MKGWVEWTVWMDDSDDPLGTYWLMRDNEKAALLSPNGNILVISNPRKKTAPKTTKRTPR